jgi:hypothetical protein
MKMTITLTGKELVKAQDINAIKAEAERLIKQGFSIIPLNQNEKFNLDKDILTRDYTLLDLVDPRYGKFPNLGINLEKSSCLDIDLDSNTAINFAYDFLPKNTKYFFRKSIDGMQQITHYLYANTTDWNDQNNLDLTRKDIDGKTIAEFRYKGNLVVPPSVTLHKETKKPVQRFWSNNLITLSECPNIFELFNGVCFAAAISPHIKSANTGLLKLDACLKRYTSWTEEERTVFLLALFSRSLPGNPEITLQKIRRIIKANNSERKVCTYITLGKYMNIDPKVLKTWFSWIGDIKTSDEIDGKKTIIDFDEAKLDMQSILKTEFPPLRFAIHRILPEGLVVLAGKAKAMKSWTVLLICYCIQNGLDWLGFSSVKGDCLYLALEDSDRRLSDRVKKLKLDKLHEHPTIVTQGTLLGKGLEESIKQWIQFAKNPRLVVIDTLARVKPRMGRNSGTAYDMDNLLLNELQKLATTSGITILIISHLSKEKRDYDFDRIQGSVGLQGMSDAMWLLDRGDNSNSAFIKGRGRDIADFEYSITWNPETWRYDFLGQASVIKLGDTKKLIIEAMKELHKAGKEDVTPQHVSKHLGFNSNSKDGQNISRTMQRMAGDLDLKKTRYGFYKYEELDLNHDHF